MPSGLFLIVFAAMLAAIAIGANRFWAERDGGYLRRYYGLDPAALVPPPDAVDHTAG